MSEQDTKPVSALTGTFQVLKGVPEADQSGKDRPETGNSLPPATDSDMEVLAQNLNTAIRAIGRDLRFQVDMQTGHSVIQVLDRETGEIIRQIPPENAKTYVSEQGEVALRLYDDRV